MKVLAIEPFYAGSHQTFLDQWIECSSHAWTLLTLPGRKWKWRMRHAPVTFAQQLAQQMSNGEAWDVIFCSSMLNLAEFRGLAPRSAANLPTVIYFHENQFTYPNRFEQERDLHFGFINLSSALAADAVWFNSDFHRRDFLAGARIATRKMPDYRLDQYLPTIEAKSAVHPPGLKPIESKLAEKTGPLHFVWAARWEHDKQPEIFFDALRELRAREHPFRISVLGVSYAEVPEVFATAREEFAPITVRWGYQPNRAEYEQALREADIAISTAGHEFFGLAAVETLLADLYPVWPKRLTYPELLDLQKYPEHQHHFYEDDVPGLVARLSELLSKYALTGRRPLAGEAVKTCAKRFLWEQRGPALDAALEKVANARQETDFQAF